MHLNFNIDHFFLIKYFVSFHSVLYRVLKSELGEAGENPHRSKRGSLCGHEIFRNWNVYGNFTHMHL